MEGTLPFKPMLSGKAPADLSQIKYPVYVSPKLDGIRCLVTNKGPVSRNLKPIANDFIHVYLKARHWLIGCDGELIVGAMTGNDVWNRSNSGVMKKTGRPDFTFCIFDHFIMPDTFKYRQNKLFDLLQLQDTRTSGRVILLEQIKCTDHDHLRYLEERYVSQGYEGVMIRDPMGDYKYGRSTTKEGGLLKLKRFEDREAIVLDMVERMHNANEATRDALGRTKRSTAKAGKVGTGMMGALKCRMMCSGVEFELGTGFTEEQRKEIWKKPLGGEIAYAKFKCQGLTPDGVPRFPVFLGFRDERDMDAKETKRAAA